MGISMTDGNNGISIMPKMFIHVGPFKSGTTAFQNYMWHHRDTLLKEGTLYPETGIVAGDWGARHLQLARGPNEVVENVFENLHAEIASNPDAHTVVLSSERFSARIGDLVARRKWYDEFDPILVVAVRDEVTLLRSWYLQILKSRIRKYKKSQTKDLTDVEAWVGKNRDRFNYGKMLAPWISAFGEERIIYVPYERKPGFDIISGLSNAIGLPHLESNKTSSNGNLSIGAFAANMALKSARFGRIPARLGLEIGSLIETKFSDLKRQELPGFDPHAVREYFNTVNAVSFKTMPGFARAHKQATEAPSAE
jgi:hypothetical protein